MPMRVSGAREPEELVAEHPARPVGGDLHEPRVGEGTQRPGHGRAGQPAHAGELRRGGTCRPARDRAHEVDGAAERFRPRHPGRTAHVMSSLAQIVSRRYDSATVLIDCDIHVGYEQIADLLPYLDGPTRELVVNSGTNGLAMPSYPWSHPAGWFRHDLYERGTGSADFAYLTLDTLRERHLDVYDISLGVVEPDEAAAFSVLPNAQLAARLCSAYNDWLLEHWLEEEPRLRGMLVVPAQYPE